MLHVTHRQKMNAAPWGTERRETCAASSARLASISSFTSSRPGTVRPRLNQAVSLDAATVTREIVIPGETLEEAGLLVQVGSIIEFALADKGG